jgi:hypothetical protein
VHPHAELAAEAAEAAGAQRRFWSMHNALFEHQDALAPADLMKYTIVLNLSLKRFASDLSDQVQPPESRPRRGDLAGRAPSVTGRTSLARASPGRAVHTAQAGRCAGRTRWR